jgi:hypothetical protein
LLPVGDAHRVMELLERRRPAPVVIAMSGAIGPEQSFALAAGGSGDVFRGRDLRRQNRRKPARCQRRTVSGRTMAIARRHDGNTRAPMSSFSRSTRWSVGRLPRRRRTLTWWRSTAFSMISSRRGRTASTATPAISLFRSARGQLRPQPPHAAKDPRPDLNDTRQTHPLLGPRTR